ncbi:RNA polymerase sigma factor [Chania multitudinisentens]|uniref:RNA polymerase sigma factor n=1 Tax=Chania multitudinisentens TaxID=1639108 RepID=UPI0003E12D8E|nr:RNA polymerase sigma factor [Chania multitudinisentens]
MRVSDRLIEAACAGDKAAITQLLTICQPDLKRFARRTCANSEDAEDAVQIALWQLYTKIGALRTIGAFATWLFRIVERECYRLFTGRKDTLPLHAVDSEATQAPLTTTDLQTDLTVAIEALPDNYRAVLILRDVKGLTAQEVAIQLGITVEAIKSRLHRARTMVREKLVAGGYWNATTTSKVTREK